MGRCYSESHICQCLSRLSTFRRNSPITIDGDRVKNGQQFVDGVLDLSRGLIEFGLKSGDVVAISALNSDLYLEWLLAITFVGGIAATLNHRWSLEEALFAMEDVKPIMLVTDNEYKNNWHSDFQPHSVPSLRWHVLMDTHNRYDPTGNILTTSKLKMPSPTPQPFNYSSTCNCAAIVCFTSGTTGRPKGVILSHSALLVQSLAKIAAIGYNEDDVYLHTAPLGHIGGLSSALALLMLGACHVLVPKFEAKSALQAIEQHHVTSFITVPAIMSDMISLIRTKDTWEELVTVKKILNGGGSLSAKLIEDATNVFPMARLFTAYGMTEACSSLTFLTLNDPKLSLLYRQEGVCVGKPAPHVELMIKTEGSGRFGQILTRGPHLMIGYWDHQILMKSNPGYEGWHETGDIGRIDDHGNLWLIGRLKGRIKSGGENIYPEEVETVISKHPAISAIAIIGLPDARLTEMVVACFQLNRNWKWSNSSFDHSDKEKETCISSEILQQFCRTNHLTGFKIPKKFIIWSKKFPMTTSGKLRRDKLKAEIMLHMQLLPSSSL